MKDVTRTCNLTIGYSKFTLNIKIYDEFKEKPYKLVIGEKLCLIR